MEKYDVVSIGGGIDGLIVAPLATEVGLFGIRRIPTSLLVG